MQILELHTLSPSQTSDVLSLMAELDSEIRVTPQMVHEAVKAPGTHFFAAIADDGRIVGCASLCVSVSPTGRKAGVEDVVVSSAVRGQGIGRSLVERLIDFCRQELLDVDLHLTSRPQRAAANELYRSLGFIRRETNYYRLKIKGGEILNESV